MATYSVQLAESLREYIESEKPASFALKQKLQSTSSQVRYKILMEVRGTGDNISWTGAHVGAFARDLEGLMCMLDGLTSTQKFDILRVQSTTGATALLLTVTDFENYSTTYPPIHLLEYLLTDISVERKFHLLILHHENGSSVLSRCAFSSYTDCMQLLMSSLSRDQQQALWKLKGNNMTSAVEQCGPMMLSTANVVDEIKQKVETINGKVSTLQGEKAQQQQELTAISRKVKEQEQKIAIQKEQVTELQKQLVDKGKAQQQLKEKCITQENQMRELKETQQQMAGQQQQVLRAMTERQQAMEMMLEQLQIELSRPIVTDETGDQEIEELENY